MSAEMENSSLSAGSFRIILLSRLALNMQMRVIYPFLPSISRSLGVPLQTTSLLLTARAVANLSSPIYGALADRFGRRSLMLAGLVILTTGSFLVVVAPSFGLVLAAMAFLSLCKAVYDPAVLAYLGDVIPYARRGRVMGILAMMWPGSWLIAVPAAGFLITRLGWRSPFLLVCLLGGLSLWLTLRSPDVGSSNQQNQTNKSARINWRQVFSEFRWFTWLAPLITLCQVLALENIYIIYGAWLEGLFSLSPAALGVASLVICLAEFSAEGLSAGWVDRIGKRRAVLGGLALNAISLLLLPRLTGSLLAALSGLLLVYITYDFSIVSTLPLISELVTHSRAALLALNVAAMAVARLISSLIAAPLWESGGLAANCLVSAAAIFLAWILLAGFIPDVRPVVILPSTSSD